MNMTFISLKSQLNMLLYNVNHIIIDRELFQLGVREIKNQLFSIYFSIQDFSLNN